MNQPVIDRAISTGDTDTTGRKWSQALVDAKGRIMAGYDQQGEFHAYVDTESLFVGAMLVIDDLVTIAKDKT